MFFEPVGMPLPVAARHTPLGRSKDTQRPLLEMLTDGQWYKQEVVDGRDAELPTTQDEGVHTGHFFYAEKVLSTSQFVGASPVDFAWH